MLPTNADMSRRKASRGFTLLELLVVLVVLGLLASLVAPKYFKQLGKSESKTARAQIEGLAKALDLFRLDNGQYPPTDPGLSALVVKSASFPKWNGPYLQKSVPQDPWGRDYLYKSPGDHGEYDLSSLGKDGTPGGEDENADVVSWQ